MFAILRRRRRTGPGPAGDNTTSPELKAELPWACLIYRHTFGSQLAMKGESLYKIATLMGKSPEICRTHYAAVLPEAMADTLDFRSSALRPHSPLAALPHSARIRCGTLESA